MNIPLDVLEAMEQEAAMGLRDSIDFEVTANTLVSMGWTDVIIDRLINREEVDSWAEANCAGQRYHRNGRWVFELKSDAVLFKLKWA